MVNTCKHKKSIEKTPRKMKTCTILFKKINISNMRQLYNKIITLNLIWRSKNKKSQNKGGKEDEDGEEFSRKPALRSHLLGQILMCHCKIFYFHPLREPCCCEICCFLLHLGQDKWLGTFISILSPGKDLASCVF